MIKTVTALFGAGMVVGACSAHAQQWSPQQQTEFVNGCLSNCKGAPGPCKAYCECMLKAVRQAFPVNATFIEATRRNDPAVVKQLQGMAQACIHSR